jgi:hypothetical protein
MERQLTFLKRHGFVLAGVGLPLLVVLATVLARMIPHLLVDAPRYDVVYTVGGGYSGTLRDRVSDVVPVDGRLVVRWTQLEQAASSPTQRLYRLDPASGELLELDVPEAGDLAGSGGRAELVVGGLADVHLDTKPRAPDGYEFETSYSGGGGLFGELFYRSGRGPRSVIHKDGRRIDVPHPNPDAYGYGAVSFIGWAIPNEVGR